MRAILLGLTLFLATAALVEEPSAWHVEVTFSYLRAVKSKPGEPGYREYLRAQEALRTANKVGMCVGLSVPRPTYRLYPEPSSVPGDVTLQGIVGADGRIHHLKVTQSANGELEAVTLASIQRWRFEPALIAGLPLAMAIEFHVSFK